MVLVTCDRCGKKIRNPKRKTKRTLCAYVNPIKRKYETIDLCSGCRKELDDFMDMAESYFMNNKDNAIDIFETYKFYKG